MQSLLEGICLDGGRSASKPRRGLKMSYGLETYNGLDILRLVLINLDTKWRCKQISRPLLKKDALYVCILHYSLHIKAIEIEDSNPQT
jgi:hypothetical protein